MDYKGADCSDRDFTGNRLVGACFDDAEVRGALFFDAVLRDASFEKAKGVGAAQFGGADLSGAQFPDGFELPGIEHAASVTQGAKHVFFVVLLACALCWLTIANVSDGALIGNATRSTLPIIESEISIARFFILAPVLLLIAYAYFIVHLQRVWEELTLLPAIFPDGRSIVRRMPQWLPIGLVRLYFGALAKRRPPLIGLQIGAVVVALWLVQPFTMMLFGARYIITRDIGGLTVLLTLFFLSTLLAATSFTLTRSTLRGEFRYLVRRTESRARGRLATLKRHVRTYGSGLVVAGAASLVFAVTTWDYLGERGLTREFESWRLMRLIGFRFTATIRDVNLANSQLDLSGRRLYEARFIDSEFSSADLSHSDLSRAYLLRSRFDDVRFDGAELDGLYVNGASFRSSTFHLVDRQPLPGLGAGPQPSLTGEVMNSCLASSYWTGNVGPTVFFNDSFRDAVFHRVGLSRVFFTQSDLSGASFRRPRFDGAYFAGVTLHGAVFESITEAPSGDDAAIATFYGSELHGAYFREVTARLDINDSSVRGARFLGDVSGIHFDGADLRGADFSDVSWPPGSLENVCVDRPIRVAGTLVPVDEQACERWLAGGASPAGITAGVQGDVCAGGWASANVVADMDHRAIAIDLEDCLSCHVADGVEAIGPPLAHAFGNRSGRSPDYQRYSATIRGMGVLWDADTLDLYLRSPDRLVPSNRMHLIGIRDAARRQAIVSAVEALAR